MQFPSYLAGLQRWRDKGKPAVRLGRKAAGPSWVAGLPNVVDPIPGYVIRGADGIRPASVERYRWVGRAFSSYLPPSRVRFAGPGTGPLSGTVASHANAMEYHEPQRARIRSARVQPGESVVDAPRVPGSTARYGVRPYQLRAQGPQLGPWMLSESSSSEEDFLGGRRGDRGGLRAHLGQEKKECTPGRWSGCVARGRSVWGPRARVEGGEGLNTPWGQSVEALRGGAACRQGSGDISLVALPGAPILLGWLIARGSVSV